MASLSRFARALLAAEEEYLGFQQFKCLQLFCESNEINKRFEKNDLQFPINTNVFQRHLILNDSLKNALTSQCNHLFLVAA